VGVFFHRKTHKMPEVTSREFEMSDPGTPSIEDRRVVSAGGPLSWIDLALHVVRALCGADAARVAADFAVVDTAPQLRRSIFPRPSGRFESFHTRRGACHPARDQPIADST
jgi:transcriptional regulator GlxA family with amidase domain